MGFEINPSILTQGSIFENSRSLISNADISITPTFGCSALIFLTSSYPFICGILISHKIRSIFSELFLKCSNARRGSVNPYALKPCLFSESLIGFTISNSSSITNIDRMSSSNRNEPSYVDSNIVIEIASVVLFTDKTYL